MKYKKIWIAFFIVFTAGIFIGIFGGRLWSHYCFMRRMDKGPEEMKKFFVGMISRDLGLSDQQAESFSEALELRMDMIEKLRKEHFEKIKSIHDEAFKEIKPPLNDEQKKKLLELENRFKKHKPPPLPPPG